MKLSELIRKPCKFETLDRYCAMSFNANTLVCIHNLKEYDDMVCGNYRPVNIEETYGFQVQK